MTELHEKLSFYVIELLSVYQTEIVGLLNLTLTLYETTKIWILTKLKAFVYLKIGVALLYMTILGTPSSAANKDMVSKIWTNGDKIF